MACPSGQGDATQALERTRVTGYRLYQCRRGRRTVSKPTGYVPTEVVLMVVL
jgi:hypothetical protein